MGAIKTTRVMRKEFLPKWFKISNYKSLNKFTFDQWVDVIGERYTMNQILESFGGVAQLKSLNFTPDLVFDREITDEKYSGTTTQPQSTFKRSSVKSLTLQGHYLLGLHISRLADHLENFPRTEVESDNSPENNKKPLDLMLQNTGRHNTPVAHVVIDLSASDKRILEGMQLWLQEYRIASNRPAASNSHYFDGRHSEWYDWRVIPYLDLHLWEKFSGLKISNALMAKTIFSDKAWDDKKSLDKLCKLTKPNALILLTETGWDSLHTVNSQHSVG